MSFSYDTLVVGSGPSGIAAAIAAARGKKAVGLVDDNPAPGGQIWRRDLSRPRHPDAEKQLAQLNFTSVDRLQGCRVFDHPANGVLHAECDGVAITLRYKKLILATGARERFLPFPGWTLPNVMGAGALDALVRGGLPIAGKTVVVAGTGPLLLAVAAHLAEHGARIAAVCEQATKGQILPFLTALLGEPAKVKQVLGYRVKIRGANFHTGCWPVAARGGGQIEAVIVSNGRRQWEIACDYLACGFHLIPNVELPVLVGCRLQDGFVAVDDLQRTSVENVFCAGEPTGIGGVDKALIEGEIAGLACAGALDEARHLARHMKSRRRFARAMQKAFALRTELKALASEDTIICRCEDVPFGRLHSCTSWREAKLHTRCGMGPCQGRICGAATAFLFGWGADSVRPPVFPALLSSLVSASQSDDIPTEAQ
ncbi:FAD/NAD(P)-binding oxidoreductase [Alloacidobacterium sp.]|uniref:FAD/NAD(P)-binding oxidoreductase n=1 Tax=Alloacidobacterium sp. TaxID=2951999 RepID=UPI002D66B9F5|nr:FAD/NAD(P)-binding oxidoreductase [Alloacidobacterium sp.]HYK35751.1 FAD/NAD(P)-binding oxidoreductase [Alloacidobacterium sp.]